MRDKKTGRFTKGSNRKIYNNFDKLTSESSYWAGFLFGDGSVDNNNKLQICLSNKAHNHLIKLSQFLFHTDYTNTYDGRCHLQITDETLSHNLQQFGIYPNKTYNHTLILPPKYQLDFIRGYFDADGWFSYGRYKNKDGYWYDRYTWGICSYLKSNLEVINQLLLTTRQPKKVSNRNIYELRLGSKKEIANVCKKLYGQPNYNSKWDQICQLMNF